MALPALNWRMLTPVTVTATNTIHTLLDAIYSAGNQSTYADGTTRTGANTAWTWERDRTTFAGVTTAVVGNPPAVGSSMEQRIIVCGHTSAPASALRYHKETTFVASRPLIGVAKSAGSYGVTTNWTSAVASSASSTPFSAGEFSGYCTTGNLGTALYSTLYMYESQEAVAVFATVGTTVHMAFIAGAFVDPLSTNLLDAETDGRVYGLTSIRNVTTGMDPGFLGSTGNSLFYGTAVVLEPNCIFFVPGSSSVSIGKRFNPTSDVFSSFTAANGEIPLVPFQIQYASGQYSGQLREMFLTRASLLSNKLRDGSTDKGYTIGYSSTTASHTLLLKV